MALFGRKDNGASDTPPLPKATLCIFSYTERPSVLLLRSLVRDIRDWPALEVTDTTKGAQIDRERSLQATRFLEQGVGDVFVMVDEDTGWDYGSLHHLVKSCYEVEAVVGGIYSYRSFGVGVATRFPPGLAVTMGQERLVQVPYVSTGFMAIHRKVLLRLTRDLPFTIHGHYPFFMPFLRQHPTALGTEELSEDWAFTARAGDAGFGIYADLRPRLYHHGSHPYRVVDSVVTLPPDQDITIRGVDHAMAQPLKSGAKLYIDPEDRFVSATVLKTGEWEPEVLEAIKPHAGDDKILLEIGAHIGAHTVQLAPLFQKVIAIEPMAHNFDLLTRNMNINEAHNVLAFRAAIGDHEGKARMIRDYQNSGACHLNPQGDDLGIEVDMTRTAPLLDNLKADVLKIDAEGAEPMIFAGNPDLLEIPVILLEYCDAQFRRICNVTGPDLLQQLRGAGYSLRALSGAQLDDRALPTGFGYTNILAVKGDDRGGG